jgi:DNA-binding MarR family transcriptional regulator
MLAISAQAVELQAAFNSAGARSGADAVSRSRAGGEGATREILRHWQEAVPNDRLAHLVKHAARGFARALQMRLAGHSVSYGHWTFLRILWESEGLTQRQLSAQAGVMEPTTFSALNAMERLGYVSRRVSPRSRKEVRVHLTPRGRALKRKLVPLAEEVNEVALRKVVTSDLATTRRTLLALIENLAADEMESFAAQRRVPSTRELSRLLNGAGATIRKSALRGRARTDR